MSQPATDLTTRQEAQAERAAFVEQRILDSAEVLFGRRGLAGTRVREIAEAAGVNSATLYNYFPSKGALYEAVLDRGVSPLVKLLEDFDASGHRLAPTQEIIRAVMEHLRKRPHLSRLIYLEAISEGDQLSGIAGKIRTLMDLIMGQLEASDTSDEWDEDLLPSVGALFLHLSFGHFALAPLLQGIYAVDPLSDEGVDSQTRFIEALTRNMFPALEAGQSTQGTQP